MVAAGWLAGAGDGDEMAVTVRGIGMVVAGMCAAAVVGAWAGTARAERRHFAKVMSGNGPRRRVAVGFAAEQGLWVATVDGRGPFVVGSDDERGVTFAAIAELCTESERRSRARSVLEGLQWPVEAGGVVSNVDEAFGLLARAMARRDGVSRRLSGNGSRTDTQT